MPAQSPKRFSEAFASKPARSPHGLAPGRRFWASLGWSGALAAVLALGVLLVGGGALTPDDGDDEVAAARSVPSASPTPTPVRAQQRPDASPTARTEKSSAPPPRSDAAPAVRTDPQAAPAAPRAAKSSPEAAATGKDTSKDTDTDTDQAKSEDPPAPAGSTLTVAAGGKCLTGGSSGEQATATVCDGSAAQRWTFAADSTLRSAGLCLTVSGGATDDRTPITVTACQASGPQLFKLTGSRTLVAQRSQKCVDLFGGASGSVIVLWECNGRDNQDWTRRT
ncbi:MULTISPECIES: RICIN domain-containing protein [Streptomyces]|uniref:RICIN domain-containing protein n=2 Tax=Streptomyces TaxID=1883 RepID=A0ABV9IT13_9ACTN